MQTNMSAANNEMNWREEVQVEVENEDVEMEDVVMQEIEAQAQGFQVQQGVRWSNRVRHQTRHFNGLGMVEEERQREEEMRGPPVLENEAIPRDSNSAGSEDDAPPTLINENTVRRPRAGRARGVGRPRGTGKVSKVGRPRGTGKVCGARNFRRSPVRDASENLEVETMEEDGAQEDVQQENMEEAGAIEIKEDGTSSDGENNNDQDQKENRKQEDQAMDGEVETQKTAPEDQVVDKAQGEAEEAVEERAGADDGALVEENSVKAVQAAEVDDLEVHHPDFEFVHEQEHDYGEETPTGITGPAYKELVLEVIQDLNVEEKAMGHATVEELMKWKEILVTVIMGCSHLFINDERALNVVKEKMQMILRLFSSQCANKLDSLNRFRQSLDQMEPIRMTLLDKNPNVHLNPVPIEMFFQAVDELKSSIIVEQEEARAKNEVLEETNE